MPIELHAAILAGGAGTRFWPLSRRARPKQLLALDGGNTLLGTTVSRLDPLVPQTRITVVCGALHEDETRSLVPEVTTVVEPSAKNTAPAAALATLRLLRQDPEAILAVLPADHHISDPEAFRESLAAAAIAAEQGHIVTLGVRPTFAATGYGYIRPGESLPSAAGHPVHRVAEFVEKPDADRAQAYFERGVSLWNAGMFVFRVDVMWDELQHKLPSVEGPLSEVRDLDDPEALAAAWARVQAISLDYGVMERTDKAAVIPVDFGWSDLGSFDSLDTLVPVDAAQNAIVGDGLCLDAKHSVVYAAAGRTVVVIGIDDLVVVDAGDAVLVCPRDQVERVRDAVAALEAAGRTELL